MPRLQSCAESFPKKGCGCFVHPRLTFVVVLLNAILEPLLFAEKIPLIGNDQFLVGWAVLAKRLLVDEDRFENRSNQPSDQTSGGLSRPEAMSMVAEQYASIWATSIFPHCRSVVGRNLSIREITRLLSFVRRGSS